MKKHKKRAEFFIVTGVGLAFALVGGFAFYWMVGKPLYGICQSRSWVEVPAEIIGSRIDRNEEYKTLDISYRYTYQNKPYIGNRYDWFRTQYSTTNFGGNDMWRVVRRHPVGTAVKCLVDPENPAESVISREICYDRLFFGLLPLFFLLLGGTLIFTEFSSNRKPRRTENKSAVQDILTGCSHSEKWEKAINKRSLVPDIILVILLLGFMLGYVLPLAVRIGGFLITLAAIIWRDRNRRCPQCRGSLKCHSSRRSNGIIKIYYCPECKLKTREKLIPLDDD